MQTGIQRPESLSSSLRGFLSQSNLILYQCFLYKLKGQPFISTPAGFGTKPK